MTSHPLPDCPPTTPAVEQDNMAPAPRGGLYAHPLYQAGFYAGVFLGTAIVYTAIFALLSWAFTGGGHE